jgi:hypothetical protein
MTFFAGRRNGGTGNSDDRPGVPSANGPANDSTGLPPWVESAVRKLLASVLPQFQPLVEKTEAVLTEAHESLAGLKRDQAAVLLELVALRRVVIGMQVQLAVDTAPPAVTVKRLPESGAKLRHERGVLGASDDA